LCIPPGNRLVRSRGARPAPSTELNLCSIFCTVWYPKCPHFRHAKSFARASFPQLGQAKENLREWSATLLAIECPVCRSWGIVMRKCSLTLFAAAVIGLTSSQVASAADLARKAPPPAPAYVPPAPLPYLWTGCYVGGNIGGAWSNVEVNNVSTGGSVSENNSGVAGGGQIGCDYQAGAWVVGFRNMFDATSLSRNVTFSTVPFTGTAASRQGIERLALCAGRRGVDQYTCNVFRWYWCANWRTLKRSYRLDGRRRCRVDVRAALVGVRRI